MKKVVMGILAHVDSGKTTLSEALLFQSGNISKLGRVDNRDSFLDTFSLERSRGITILSKHKNSGVDFLLRYGLFFFIVQMAVAKSFVIWVSNLLTKFLADAKIVLNLLQSARTVAAFF